MMGIDSENGNDPRTPRRELDVQPTLARESSKLETPGRFQALFERFWEDVAPLNSYSPETARALLALESRALQHAPHDGFASDPRSAVHAALSERAAGRAITRLA